VPLTVSSMLRSECRDLPSFAQSLPCLFVSPGLECRRLAAAHLSSRGCCSSVYSVPANTEANVLPLQRSLFHLMGWLDPQLFRRAAAMLYGGSSEASPEPYKDAGKDHWRKVVVSNLANGPTLCMHTAATRASCFPLLRHLLCDTALPPALVIRASETFASMCHCFQMCLCNDLLTSVKKRLEGDTIGAGMEAGLEECLYGHIRISA